MDLDGLSMELQTAVQRMQLLGFNAIRLPFTFDQLYNAAPKNYTLECEHPDLTQVSHQRLSLCCHTWLQVIWQGHGAAVWEKKIMLIIHAFCCVEP